MDVIQGRNADNPRDSQPQDTAAPVAEDSTVSSGTAEPVEVAASQSTGEPFEFGARASPIESDIRKGEKWLVGTNIALVVVGAVASWIYYGQLNEMRCATQASMAAAQAATKSANAEMDILRGTQAAVLVPRTSQQRNRITLVLANSGKVAATDVHGSVRITRQTMPSRMRVGKPIEREFHFERVLPDPSPGVAYTVALPGFTLADKQQIELKKQTLIVEIEFAYDDGFEDTLHERLCNAEYQLPFAGAGLGWIECNRLDEELRAPTSIADW